MTSGPLAEDPPDGGSDGAGCGPSPEGGPSPTGDAEPTSDPGERVGSHVQYEPFAADFLAHAAEAPYNALYDRPAVLALLGEVSGCRVLDLACGPGLYAEELVARGAEVVGLDHSPAMVALAAERAPAGRFLVHDLDTTPLPLPDGAVDAAVFPLAYHYLDERVALLADVRRVVRPGGVLVLSTHHPASDWDRLGGDYLAVEVVEETWSRGWRMRYWRFPLTQLCAEVAEAGWLVERLVEPAPSAELAARFPEVAARLTRLPAFVLLRLVGRG